VPDEHTGRRDDDVVWVAVRAAGRFLVTQDLDFSDARKYAPGTHHGAIAGEAQEASLLPLFAELVPEFNRAVPETGQPLRRFATARAGENGMLSARPMTGVQLALLWFLFVVLPVVAALAWWLKRRYAAAVVRLQATKHPSARSLDDCADWTSGGLPGPNAFAPPLQIHVQPATDIILPADVVNRQAGPARLRRRVLLVHAIGELAYWCALILLLFVAVLGQLEFGVLRRVAPVLLSFVVTPVAVGWALQAGLPRRLMSIAAAMVVIYAVSLVWSDAEGWQSEVGFSLGYAAITLMLSAFLRPTIRGAGLPLVAASIAGWAVFSVLIAIGVALEGPDDGDSASFIEVAVGVSELLLMLAVAIWCGWRALIALSSRYAAKRFSDIQLALATFWVVLTMFLVTSLVSESAGSVFATPPIRTEWIVLAIVITWLLWRWLQASALRAVIRTADPSIGPLLLLRVFKPSGRSQAFTDRFFAYWRFAAPVWMIAGPDLAGAYMEPDEFFKYLRGRLREHFIADPGEVAPRVATLDRLRDPDGRFRVTEVYCTADTWQPTVLEMMARAGVILLDLREYAGTRLGTRYELTEVLRRAPLQKVLVLVGSGDDVTGLRAEIESIWRDVGRSRRDRAESLELTVLQFSRSSHAEMRGLFRAAVRAAQSVIPIGAGGGRLAVGP